MSTLTLPPPARPPAGGEVVVLHDVSWEFYEEYLKEFEERRSPHSYVKGELRIMAPSARHEKSKKILAQIVEALSNELKLPRHSLGSMTLKLGLDAKGAEPDECHLLLSAPQVRDARHYDPKVDPPPDLAVEVDLTSPSLNRVPVYAALEIPEIWVYDGDAVSIGLRRDEDTYETSGHSKAFPRLSARDLTDWVERSYFTDESAWMEAFREWVRDKFGSGSD